MERAQRWTLAWGLAQALAQALASRDAEAQESSRGAVAGVVYDSLAGAALGGARVQLAPLHDLAAPVQTTMSDAAGRFRFGALPAGRYVVQFQHAKLDSIGLEPIGRELEVRGGAVAALTLALPPPARLRRMVCGDASTGVLVGTVRRADDGAPLPSATVAAEWDEVTIGAGTVARNRSRVRGVIHPSGRFVLCGVPAGGNSFVTAREGTDSTDRVPVDLPASGFLVRDLYLGAEATAPLQTGAGSGAPLRLRTGAGRLGGRVWTHEGGGRPLAGAQVRVVGGPGTRTDSRGQWTLSDLPLGTRVLEVRAIGFRPEFVAVHVLRASPAVETTLLSMRASLDTVHVRASRLLPELRDFDERRRSGTGRYLDETEVRHRAPVFTTDLFYTVPGVQVGGGSVTDRRLLVRGIGGDYCEAALFVNGVQVNVGGADADLDSWVDPAEIGGIEIYTGTTAPSRFDGGPSRCGSIVVWTRPPLRPRSRMPTTQRAIRTGGVMALSVVVAVLLGRR